MSEKTGIVKTVLLLCLFMALMIGLLVNKMLMRPVLGVEELKERGAYFFEPAKNIKPVNLTDNKGLSFTNENLKGRWSIVFFGYTFCPDICPVTLTLLNKMLDEIDEPDVKNTTKIIMVSLDPARDDIAVLNNYMKNFNADFIGVTGEFLKIHELSENFSAAFQKTPGGGKDYTIDHTGYVFLVNPEGQYQGFVRPPFTANDLLIDYLSIRAIYESR